MQRLPRSPFLLLLTAMTLAVAACGSGADDPIGSSSQAPPVSGQTSPPVTTSAASTTTAPAPAPSTTVHDGAAGMATPTSSERLLAGADIAISPGSCDGLAVEPTATCGTAAVPADWTDPTDTTIDVAYVLLPSVSGRSSATLIPFMGGPGESITAQIELLAPLSEAIPDSDLLIVDVRGVGRSGALTCAALDDASEAGLGAIQVRDTGICGEQIGPRRRNYTTVASVLDIEAIRRELALDPPSLIGFSYGTFIAQTYTTLFPGDVRGAVLDGAFPIEQSGWGTDIPTNIGTVLELRCSRTAACPGGAAAVATSIRSIAAALASNPVDVPGVDQQLTEGAFASIVQFAVQNADMVSFVSTLDDAAAGDLHALDDLARAGLAAPPVGPMSYSPALFSAVACNDYVAPFDADDDVTARRRELERRLDLLPDDEFDPFSKRGWLESGWEEGDMCLEWPATDIAPELRVPRGVDRPEVPVLVVNGDIDMQTPLSGARRVASAYPHGVLLTVPNAGHVALPVSECAAAIEFAFLADSVLPASDACIDQPVPE